MKDIKTNQADGMPLSPLPEPTIGGTVPGHTVTGSDGTNRAIDTQAIMVDDRPYSAIFADCLANNDANLHKCENLNQVNKYLASLKYGGDTSKVCTLLVNEKAHRWFKADGRWQEHTEEWVKANPYAGRGPTSAKGMLSDADVAILKKQIADLTTAVAIAPSDTLKGILAALNGKLDTHEAAVREAAMTGEAARKREIASKALRSILALADKAGTDYTIALNGALVNLGDELNIDPAAVGACMTILE